MCYRDGHLLNKLMVLSGLPPIPLLCSQVTLQRFKSKGLLWRDSIIYVTRIYLVSAHVDTCVHDVKLFRD